MPKEISAEPIYKQIQTITDKVKELEGLKAKLDIEQTRLTRGNVDKTELLFRVKRAINNLEKTPIEDRRPIYSNLIKFAELYPTKIRLGVYTPAVKRAGSCTVSNGARSPTLEEYLVWVETYPIQWWEPRFNLAELAKRRKIERETARKTNTGG